MPLGYDSPLLRAGCHRSVRGRGVSPDGRRYPETARLNLKAQTHPRGAGRAQFQRLLAELYAARAAGALEPLCALFAADALFKISGSSDGKPIALSGQGNEEIRSWLTVLLKTFRLTRHEILSMVIDGERAAVHWRASIHSRITGASVLTELVDLIEMRAGRIASYVELFVPA
ncbi:MAG: nuclear transport factor 2 family protein [Steroidobacteraceae bacterium]